MTNNVIPFRIIIEKHLLLDLVKTREIKVIGFKIIPIGISKTIPILDVHNYIHEYLYVYLDTHSYSV